MARGRAQKTLNMIDAAYDILAEIQPATVRAVCYRLFVARLIENMSKGETDKVSRMLTIAREEDKIPWEWIVDETREAESIPSWNNMADYGEAVLRSYRKNFWSMQSERLEVWSEKGTVRGTLGPILDEFAVTFRVMHGFSSATVIKNVADETGGLDCPLRVLYVGDHDPSGMCMSERDLPERLGRYGAYVDLIRTALVMPEDEDLPSFEAATKRGDPNYRWYVSHYGQDCWEVDALSPPILRSRVRAAIEGFIDREAWDQCAKVEKVERESLQSFARKFGPVVATAGIGSAESLGVPSLYRAGDEQIQASPNLPSEPLVLVTPEIVALAAKVLDCGNYGEFALETRERHGYISAESFEYIKARAAEAED